MARIVFHTITSNETAKAQQKHVPQCKMILYYSNKIHETDAVLQKPGKKEKRIPSPSLCISGYKNRNSSGYFALNIPSSQEFLLS